MNTECFCGNYAPSKISYDCNRTCSGDRHEICGGVDAITVYMHTGPTPTPTPKPAAAPTPKPVAAPTPKPAAAPIPKPAGFAPLGCFRDDRDHRVLNGKPLMESKTRMTAKVRQGVMKIADAQYSWIVPHRVGDRFAVN